MSLEIFYEKVAEGLLARAGAEIRVHGQPSCPAGILVGRDNFYIRFQQHMLRWRELLSAHVECVQREASSRPEVRLHTCHSRSAICSTFNPSPYYTYYLEVDVDCTFHINST